MKAVSPNFINRACSGHQNDIRINGMKALKCRTKLKDHIEKMRRIYVRKILIWKKLQRKDIAKCEAKGDKAWFSYTNGILKKEKPFNFITETCSFRSPRIYHIGSIEEEM